MKRCSRPLEKCKLKPPHSHQDGYNERDRQVLRRIQGNKSSYIASRNVKCYSHFEKVWPFLKLNKNFPHNLAILPVGTYPQEVKTHVHTKTHKHSQQHYSKYPKTGNSNIHQLVLNKQNISSIHWDISQQQKGTTSTCYNMDEPQKL